MPNKSTVLRWIAENETFRDQYARAREAQADSYRDEGDEISRGISTSEDSQIARVQLDWIKWNAARMAPKKYGDKVDMNLGGQAGNPIQAAIAVTFVRKPQE
jgi:hypothetical protein